jgi:hypothetical protein
MPQTLRIDARFDASGLISRMRNAHKRLAYAAVNAINNTLKRAQTEVRGRVEAEFELRKTEFVLREAAKISPFASVKQARAYGEISVGQKPRLLLSLFERGARREPVTPGAQFVAEPVIGGPARPDFKQSVPPTFRMSRLRFDRTQSGKIRAAQQRTSTYLVPEVGIFQRLAGQVSRAVYIFTKGKRLEPRFPFTAIVRRVADRWLGEEFEREVIKAVQRSRGEGL